VNCFLELAKNWLSDGNERRVLLAMMREVPNLQVKMPSHYSGREVDPYVLAALGSAFEAGWLYVFRRPEKLQPSFFLASGRSWKFEGAQIVQSNYALSVAEWARYFPVEDSGELARMAKFWLSQKSTRARVLEIEEILNDSRQTMKPDEEIIDAIVGACAQRQIYFLKRKLGGGKGAEDSSIETARSTVSTQQIAKIRKLAAPAKTWIEVLLVDSGDNTIGGVRFRLRLTDGSVREGRLGADGLIRVAGIEAGVCEISFPELEPETWQPA
jgi:hypothetical protein